MTARIFTPQKFKTKLYSFLLLFAYFLNSSLSPAWAEDIKVQDGSVNDWQSFNVGEGQQTSISVVDANGNAAVNGRAIVNVLQDFATKIDGRLDINGIIAFYNAHGFDIGQNADVNVVGGLILSTLKISEADFFAGMAQLNQGLNNPGFISNQGRIDVDPGSFLALIAGAIRNTGTIAAEGGTAVLAAGSEGTLTIGGDGLVSVKIMEPVKAEVFDFNGNKVADQISNSGTIQANGGLVKLTAQGAEQLFDNIINHSGIIEANTLENKNGQIILDGGDEGIVNVTGTLNAKGDEAGETGGMIQVLGDKVGLFDGVTVDASGEAGGGTVLIGGDYHGSNPEIRNAEAVYVGAGVSINASAIHEGNGGKIIVWSEESTKVHGTLLAKGGEISGDGGFIETSAHYLNVDNIYVSTAAAHGKNGDWLLDPYNLTISSGADNNVTGTTPFEPSGSSSVLNATTLQNAMDNGDVTVQTGGDAGAGNGNITISADLSVGNILTLTAYGNVVLNNSFSGDGDLVIESQHGNITQNSGNLTLTGGAVFTATEGDISLTSAANDIARMDVTGINVTVTDTNGIEIGTGQVTTNFSLTTTGAITQSSYLTAGGTATLAAGAGNDITLNNVSNNFSTVVVTSGKNVALRDTNALALGASTVSGTLSVTTGGALTQSGALSISGTTTIDAGANDITLSNTSNDFGNQTLTLTGKDITIRDNNASGLQVQSLTGTGDVNITATNDLSLTGGGSTFNTSKVNAAINLTAGSTKTLSIGARIQNGASNATNVSLSGGTITQTRLINTAGGSLALSGGGVGGITLTTGDLSTNMFTTITGSNLSGNVSILDTTASNFNIGNMTFTGSGALSLQNQGSGATMTQTVGTTITTQNSNVTFTSNSGSMTQAGAINTNGGKMIFNVGAANASITQSGTGSINTSTGGGSPTYGLVEVQNQRGSGGAWTVNLNGSSNNFQSLALENKSFFGSTAQNAALTVTDNNNLALGLFYSDRALSDTLSSPTINTSGANGNITQLTSVSGLTYEALKVTGTGTFNSGAGNITLTQSTNDFATVAITAGNNVNVRDTNALILGASTVSGTLDVTTAGAITQSGALAVTGTTTITAGTSNNITLNNSANNFGTVAVTSGNNVTLRDSGAIGLGSITANGGVTVTSGGAISGTGTVTAGADSVFTAATTIGTKLIPIDVAITGTLTLTGTSAGLTGAATVLDYKTLGSVTGSVFFNGTDLNATPVAAAGTDLTETTQIVGGEIGKVTPSNFKSKQDTQENPSAAGYYFTGEEPGNLNGPQLINTSGLEFEVSLDPKALGIS